jgi:hypothetical protein
MYVSHWLRAETLDNPLSHLNYRPRFDLINFSYLKRQVAFKDDLLMGIA